MAQSIARLVLIYWRNVERLAAAKLVPPKSQAVGPVWYGGDQGEPQLLESCYRESLKLAVDNQLKSIAFPAISCGAYRYTIDKACVIAISEVSKFLDEFDEIEKVVFVCFDSKVEKQLNKALMRLRECNER